MGIFTAHPESKEKTAALKAFMKALKINFEEDKLSYDPKFVEKIKQSERAFQEGKFKAIDISDLWK